MRSNVSMFITMPKFSSIIESASASGILKTWFELWEGKLYKRKRSAQLNFLGFKKEKTILSPVSYNLFWRFAYIYSEMKGEWSVSPCGITKPQRKPTKSTLSNVRGLFFRASMKLHISPKIWALKFRKWVKPIRLNTINSVKHISFCLMCWRLKLWNR